MSISTQITELNNNINDLKSIKQNIKKAINTDFNVITNEKLEDYADIIKDTFETYKDYIPFTETEQATEITVNDAMEYSKNKLELFGNTEQNQYQGYNLYNKYGQLNFPTTGYVNKTVLLPDGTLKTTSAVNSNISRGIQLNLQQNTTYTVKGKLISCNVVSEENIASTEIRSYTDTWHLLKRSAIKATGSFSYTFNSGSGTNFFLSLNTLGSISNNPEAIYDEIMVYEGTDNKDYEPYVGGQSSPSLDYPQTIHDVSGHNEFLVQNAFNLFNMEEYANQNSYYYDYSNEGLTIKHKDNRAIANILPAINVEGNTSYYIKSDIDITVSVAQYRDTGAWITTSSVQNNQEFITNINAKTIKLKIGINIPSFPTLIGKVYFSTSKEYKKQTAELDLPEGMEMCKINTYQDDFVKENGSWKVPNKIQKIDSYNGETITTPYISTTGGLDTGATVYYVGNTDLIITDTTLISQLNALERIMTYSPQTNITATSADLKPIMTLSYKKIENNE